MQMEAYLSTMTNIRNFVWIGEAGSGKSELGLNWAAMLAKRGRLSVQFFDLDQTKPNIRAREYAAMLTDAGVGFHYYEQTEDVPVVASGVRESLANPNSYTILDVGGNAIGARMIGQFAEAIRNTSSVVYFPINVYRPWSDTREHILETMESLRIASGLEAFHVVGNPNFGPDTRLESVLEGAQLLEERIGTDRRVDFLAVEERFCAEVAQRQSLPVFPVHSMIRQPYTV